MKKLNEAEYTTNLGQEDDGPRNRKTVPSLSHSGGGIESYDPETGRVKFAPVVPTPFRKLSRTMKEALVDFEAAAKSAPKDEQVEYLFKEFKRTARSLANHIKKHYPEG